ncbi:MAG: hypothetical protein FD146_624 [Anaerolineaceae bacterium]|nr:MAG: hypothetical protein FD146_624 [Anaerolineaceae bacterium]
MTQLLFWLYIVNLTLLILHEMDSAYWKEWNLFRLPGGVGGFLLIHLPLWILALWGAAQVWEGSLAGLILSLVVAVAGLAAFLIHAYFLRKGRPEFNTPVSKGILWALLALSVPQLILTILMF